MSEDMKKLLYLEEELKATAKEIEETTKEIEKLESRIEILRLRKEELERVGEYLRERISGLQMELNL